jgi:hypothetical protein
VDDLRAFLGDFVANVTHVLPTIEDKGISVLIDGSSNGNPHV